MKKAESFDLKSQSKIIPTEGQFIFHSISCWLFDSASARANNLLTGGNSNFSACILAFELSSDYSKMSENILSLLQSTRSGITSNSPIFFIVGTYKNVSKVN